MFENSPVMLSLHPSEKKKGPKSVGTASAAFRSMGDCRVVPGTVPQQMLMEGHQSAPFSAKGDLSKAIKYW